MTRWMLGLALTLSVTLNRIQRLDPAGSFSVERPRCLLHVLHALQLRVQRPPVRWTGDSKIACMNWKLPTSEQGVPFQAQLYIIYNIIIIQTYLDRIDSFGWYKKLFQFLKGFIYILYKYIFPSYPSLFHIWIFIICAYIRFCTAKQTCLANTL